MAQQMTEDQRRQQWAKLTAKAWEDESFRKNFEGNPKPVLAEYGFVFPENYDIRIVEQGTPEAQGIGQYTLSQKDNGAYEVLMRLPNKPVQLAEGELSDAELESVAGGVGNICCCCSCCPCCCCT